jgi:hypothetical protein
MWAVEAFVTYYYDGEDTVCMGFGEEDAMKGLFSSVTAKFLGELKAQRDRLVFLVEPGKSWYNSEDDRNTLRGDSRGFRCYLTETSEEDIRKFLGYGS